MKSARALAATLVFATVFGRAQEKNPADSMAQMPMSLPQTAPAPAPCKEDMPGMQMCPKSPSTSSGMGQMPGMQMDAGTNELMEQMKDRLPLWGKELPWSNEK